MREEIASETKGCPTCVAQSAPEFADKDICLPKFPTIEAFEFLAINLVVLPNSTDTVASYFDDATVLTTGWKQLLFGIALHQRYSI